MTTMRDDTTRAEQARILEAALAAAGEPVSASRLRAVFAPEPLSTAELEAALDWLAQRYEGSALELVHVAGGWRLQVRAAYALHVQRLQPERPARYSRAVMETLALIAYRQPITRGKSRPYAASPSARTSCAPSSSGAGSTRWAASNGRVGRRFMAPRPPFWPI